MGCINWAWKIQGLKSNEKVLLLAIADRADKESGVCVSPVSRLSRDAGGWSRQATNRVLKRLEGFGLVRIALRYPGTDDYSRMYTCEITVDAESWRPEDGKGRARKPSGIMLSPEKFKISFHSQLLPNVRNELGPKGLAIYETWLSALHPIDITGGRMTCRVPSHQFALEIWKYKDVVLKTAAAIEPKIRKLRFLWDRPKPKI